MTPEAMLGWRYLWVWVRRSSLAYNPVVDAAPDTFSRVHDETLLDWFLSLEPEQRLAELESRLTFFNSVRRDDDAKLSPDTRTA